MDFKTIGPPPRYFRPGRKQAEVGGGCPRDGRSPGRGRTSARPAPFGKAESDADWTRRRYVDVRKRRGLGRKATNGRRDRPRKRRGLARLVSLWLLIGQW